MKRSFGIRTILAVCITIGLLMVPAAVSTMANSSNMTSQVEMSDDMPCCPDAPGQNLPRGCGCKDCPLMAICSLTTIQAFPVGEFVGHFQPVLLALISVADDRFADGLIGTPPARPPRSLV